MLNREGGIRNRNLYPNPNHRLLPQFKPVPYFVPVRFLTFKLRRLPFVFRGVIDGLTDQARQESTTTGFGALL